MRVSTYKQAASWQMEEILARRGEMDDLQLGFGPVFSTQRKSQAVDIDWMTRCVHN